MHLSSNISFLFKVSFIEWSPLDCSSPPLPSYNPPLPSYPHPPTLLFRFTFFMFTRQCDVVWSRFITHRLTGWKLFLRILCHVNGKQICKFQIFQLFSGYSFFRKKVERISLVWNEYGTIWLYFWVNIYVDNPGSLYVLCEFWQWLRHQFKQLKHGPEGICYGDP